MDDATVDKRLRDAAFAQQLVADVTEQFDEIGGASDLNSRTGGVGLWMSSHDESVGWDELEKARDELTSRLDQLGIEWEINTEIEQREWRTHEITGTSGPYTGEINTQPIPRSAISEYESEFGKIPDEPENADIFRDSLTEE